MTEQNKKPEIRFEGFINEWKEIELGKHSIIKGRLGWKSLKQNEYIDDGPSMIAGKHINNGVINWSAVDHIPQWRYDESPEIMLKDNDVIFSKDGSLGNPAVIKTLQGYATINSTMMLVRLDSKINSDFFYQVLKTKNFENLIKLKVSGSSIPHLFQADMKKFTFASTMMDEQSKIGTYFQNLDKLITLQQRKYDKLINVKKAMLEKMFPQAGADVPEIRFKGFAEKWEEKKLGDVGSVAMNRRIFKNQTSNEGDVPFYKIGTFGSVPDAFISRKLFDEYKSKYPYPEKGDILISASGSIGRIVEYVGKDEYFQDSNIVWLQHDSSVKNIFLKQFYSVVKWSGLEGSTIKRLYNKNILETSISFPCPDEQTKIGTLFEHLDNLITLHQRELEKLKNIKKACLAKMFV